MGFPKALLVYRGKTFLETVLDACVAARLDPAVVVLGPDAPKILATVDLRAAIVMRNEHPETGQIASIKHGISAIINRPVDAALIWPVDQPHVLVGTVERLIQEFRGRHAAIAVPLSRGRRGHPSRGTARRESARSRRTRRRRLSPAHRSRAGRRWRLRAGCAKGSRGLPTSLERGCP